MGLIDLLRRLLGGGTGNRVINERRDRAPDQRRKQTERDDQTHQQTGHGADQQGDGPKRMRRH
ncbi:MAG: hypothetical protein GC159_19370 [Phycisphaera sp.]|nr:hypothetical protein [Phycisphaera sp.]